MALNFWNQHHSPVSVCIIYLNPSGCPESRWSKVGWWSIGANGRLAIINGNLNNQFYYFYAEAPDGIWGGSFSQSVTNQKFSWCLDTVSTDNRIVGFAEIDTGNHSDFTVTLTG